MGAARIAAGRDGVRRKETPQVLRRHLPLRTETPLRDVPVLRSAYFHKEYTVLFAPKRSTFSRSATYEGGAKETAPEASPV